MSPPKPSSSGRKFVQSTNPGIVYYPSKQLTGKCTSVHDCPDVWWIEKKNGASEYVTEGPKTGLYLQFTGSTVVEVHGSCPGKPKTNSSSLDIKLNDKTSHFVWSANGTAFAAAWNLKSTKNYNLTINYGGEGQLGIVGFGLDPNATIIPVMSPHSMASTTNGNIELSRPTQSVLASSNASQSHHARPSSGITSSGQGPAELGGSSSPISRAALGGIIAGAAASLCMVVVAAWFIRRRILARRAPSYAFRKASNAEAHWTQRPQSPAIPRSADWESFTLPAKEETVHSPLLEQHSSVTESRMGTAL